MTESQRQFAGRLVRRKKLFLVLSITGVAFGTGFGAYSVLRRAADPGFSLGPRLVIVLLVLLNARQNLRQYRVATILEGDASLRAGAAPPEDPA